MRPAPSFDSQDGQARISLCEHELVPLPEGALFWPARKTLIVSDLHLEKGVSYARSGQYIPPYDTQTTLDLVEKLIRQLRPDCVISLGDSFHTPYAADGMSEALITRIQSLTAAHDWVWIEGNHDPIPPEHLGGRAIHTMQMGRLIFRHEPTGETGEIAGHLHPCAKIRSRSGKRVRRRCFVTNGEALILPAMGAYTGGLNVLDQAVTGILGPKPNAFMLGEAKVYAIPATTLVPDQEKGPRWTF